MELLCENIVSYISFISKEYNLQISIHFFKEFLSIFTKYPKLSIFNNHYNPYCMTIKSTPEGHEKCIECQQKVLKKCRKENVFKGYCHAGVLELIFAIDDYGFISISGYGKNNHYLKDENPPEELCKILLPPLIIMFQKLFEDSKTHPKNENDEILNYINLNYIHLTLDELCEFFHKSKSSLSHSFKKNNGVTLKSYCNNLKLRDAEILLKNSELPVTEIAMATGFESISYFIELFKKKNGVTPLKYKKINFN